MEQIIRFIPGRLVFVGQDFLSDENTTCSVRLNRESSFVGLLRDVHGVLWFGEVSSFHCLIPICKIIQ